MNAYKKFHHWLEWNLKQKPNKLMFRVNPYQWIWKKKCSVQPPFLSSSYLIMFFSKMLLLLRLMMRQQGHPGHLLPCLVGYDWRCIPPHLPGLGPLEMLSDTVCGGAACCPSYCRPAHTLCRWRYRGGTSCAGYIWCDYQTTFCTLDSGLPHGHWLAPFQERSRRSGSVVGSFSSPVSLVAGIVAVVVVVAVA